MSSTLNQPTSRPADLCIGPDDLRVLRRRSRWRHSVQACTNLAIYATLASISASSLPLPMRVLALPAMGLVMTGFLGAAHECAHGTMSASRMSNRAGGVFWSCLILFNFSLYRSFHLAHHRFTSGESDPEPTGEFHSVGQYFRALPAAAFFLSFWAMACGAVVGRFPEYVHTEEQRRSVRLDNVYLGAFLSFAAALTMVAPATAALVYWLPLCFFFPFVFLTSLPEHYACEVGDDPLTNTRTVEANALFRYIFWNGNYHAEHHLHPDVPSSNLPAVHALLRSKIRYRSESYFAFHREVLAALWRRSPEESRP